MAGGAVAPLPRSRSASMITVIVWGATLAIAACGGASSTPSPSPTLPKLSITAGTSGYDVEPATSLPAGLIEVVLRNGDRMPHEFRFATPLGSTTLDQIRATVSNRNLDQQLPKQVEFGFAWDLPPAAAQTLYLNYQASTTFVFSLISAGPSAPVEASHGYLAQFTVRGTPATGQPQPSVTGTLSINAHSVSVPKGFGKGTFAMVNTDSLAHRLTFFRFTNGAKPLAQVIATFSQSFQQQQLTGPTPPPPPSGPPPDEALGLEQLGGPDPFPAHGCSCIMGSRVLASFALTPGTYVALGDGFDAKTNVLEASEGLAAEFTVS